MGPRTRVAGEQQEYSYGKTRQPELREFSCPRSQVGQPAPLVFLEKGERTMATATLDWSQCPDVESVPGKISGAWVLRGTRMPVAAIFENIEAGASLDDIMEWFDGLDREQVKAVIEFAVRSLDKAPAYAP
jgi:uncharacterized protein (DUF433 family)